MEGAIPWWGSYLGAVVASALVAYLTVLVVKGLVKSFRDKDEKSDDPWWWQWGWRGASVLTGALVGLSLVDPPWGCVLGVIGGGFASWIVRLVKRLVKAKAESL